MKQATAGERFRQALADESPLQIVGTINANHALLARRAGYRAIYLSGGGVAANSLGMPDLGISTHGGRPHRPPPHHRRHPTLPLLVDIDTGFGASAFNIARTMKLLVRRPVRGRRATSKTRSAPSAAATAPARRSSPPDEMVDRLHAAADARTDPAFCPDGPAPTPSPTKPLPDASIDRVHPPTSRPAPTCIFAEAVYRPRPPTAEFRQPRRSVPVLANITEFGQHPPLQPATSSPPPASTIVLYLLRSLPRHEQGRRPRRLIAPSARDGTPARASSPSCRPAKSSTTVPRLSRLRAKTRPVVRGKEIGRNATTTRMPATRAGRQDIRSRHT